MGRRRQKSTRKRRASSADVRFTFLVIALVALLLLLGSLLLTQVRRGEWRDAAISGGVIVVLLGLAIHSGRQRRS